MRLFTNWRISPTSVSACAPALPNWSYSSKKSIVLASGFIKNHVKFYPVSSICTLTILLSFNKYSRFPKAFVIALAAVVLPQLELPFNGTLLFTGNP
nr:hypothetical protein [Sphingobacterium sp. JB170]